MKTLHIGSTGKDVGAAQWLLAGHNIFKRQWYFGEVDQQYGLKTGAAAKQMKHDLGYIDEDINTQFGQLAYDFLIGHKDLPADYQKRRVARAKAKTKDYLFPFTKRYNLIGFPGQGTHSWSAPPNNWESDNAWDIAAPHGTEVLAMCGGHIGPASQFGPLDSSNPRFAGLRFHLKGHEVEIYYAHLSKIIVQPEQLVEQGQVLGLSGSANGVDHLHIGFTNYHLVESVISG